VQGLSVKEERWSIERVRADAEAYLARRAAEIAAEPAPEPEPPPIPSPRLRWPRHPGKEGNTHLYVVGCLDAVKIGFAADLYMRLNNLRVDNPNITDFAAYYEMPKRAAQDVERFVHLALAEQRIGGEWFRVPMELALAEVDRIAAIVKSLYRL
jgi:hypothetical protein